MTNTGAGSQPSRAEVFTKRLLEGTSYLELVSVKADDVPCKTIRDLAIHPGGQPVLTSKFEIELGRWGVMVDVLAVAMAPDGTHLAALATDDDSELPKSAHIEVSQGAAGVTVLSDQRLITTLLRGDFLVGPLNVDNGGVVCCVAHPLEHIDTVTLHRKRRLLGTKELAISTQSAIHGGLRFEILGTTTVEAQGRLGPTHSEGFELVVEAVANAHINAGRAAERAQEIRDGQWREQVGDDTVVTFDR